MKICYLDNLSKGTNKCWLAAFKKYGTTLGVDLKNLRRSRIRRVKQDLIGFQPDHIHFGGSAKTSRAVPKRFVLWMRAQFPDSRITFFCGDAYYNNFYKSVERCVNKIYMTNRSNLLTDKFEFMVCPSSPDLYHPTDQPKKCDLIFVGNNTHSQRAQKLQEIASRHNIDIYGKGWGKIGKGRLEISQYSEVCTRYKIALSDCSGELCRYTHINKWCELGQNKFYQFPRCQNDSCPQYQPLLSYMSNRVVNTLMCGLLCITPHVRGIEHVFQNKKHLVWYDSEEEMYDLIDYYLAHDEEREQIARQGRREVASKYSFVASAERILEL